MDLSRLRPYLLYDFKSDHDLVRAIEELSLKFTKERESVSDYLKDPRLVSAYTAFYLTTNIPKFEAVLKWLPEPWKQDWLRCDFVDLGAGPGTFSLAFKEWARGFTGSIFQIEKSAFMREQGKKIWQGLYSDAALIQDERVPKFHDKERFVLFGHSANEMGAEIALQYVDKINPAHILFIEPGTKGFFQEMLKIRQGLIERGFHVLYPCAGNLSCPMSRGEDWCHQFVEVNHGADVERLTQMARKDRRLLPLTVQAFSKNSYGKNPRERLVRVLPETKFSFEWEVCHDHQLERYQIMKRPYGKAELKELAQVLAGASLETELEKETEQAKRVALRRFQK